MRLAVSLLALGLLMLPVAAHAAASPAPAGTAVAAQAAPEACPVQHRKYLSLPERFEMANTSHDGRLTLDQAKSAKAMHVVARNFDAIDATHKGYITEDDIRAWYKARRAARRTAAEATKS